MPVTARSASWLRTTPSKVTTAPAAASWTASASSVTLMGNSVTSARTTRAVGAGSGRLGWSGLGVTGSPRSGRRAGRDRMVGREHTHVGFPG